MNGQQDKGADGPARGRREEYVFSRAAIRELDRLAVSEFGLPSIVIMENAARGCAEEIARLAAGLEGAGGVQGMRAAVLCGPGNNGGDGLAIARHLSNAGARVAVVLEAADRSGAESADAATNLAVIRAMHLPVLGGEGGVWETWKRVEQEIGGRTQMVVDALLGTGLDRAVSGRMSEAIAWVNGLEGGPGGTMVVAIDIPSGLDADSGQPAGGAADMAIRADYTLTLAGWKEGFLMPGAEKHLGDVRVVDLGVPMELVRRLGRKRD